MPGEISGQASESRVVCEGKGKISNKEYQEVTGVARMTAIRDLQLLVKKGILKSSETKGAGSYYELRIAP
ncbi:hypothetical protein [Niabella aurantiaca]|uniref:hypothetical protein n=1 Tax=Niabella aurantiaca TaxID=379900 RepID=UPI0003A4340E|nr:hypothetical protein [Niabella aurantiaca]